MRIACLSFVAIVFCLHSFGQKNGNFNYRPLRTDTTSLQVFLIDDETNNPKKICSSCTYHWLKAGQIQQTRGGFDGKLLHGTFTEYYKSGELRAKGQFEKGLKSGEWRMWFLSGEIQKITSFKKGLPHGTERIFGGDGKLKQVNHYKAGLLDGEQITYTDSIPIITRYNEGILQVKKQKVSKSKELVPKEPKPMKEKKEKQTKKDSEKKSARKEEKPGLQNPSDEPKKN